MKPQNPIVLMLGGPNYPPVDNVRIVSNIFTIPPRLVLLEVKNNQIAPTNILLNNNIYLTKKIRDRHVASVKGLVSKRITRKDGVKLYRIDL